MGTNVFLNLNSAVKVLTISVLALCGWAHAEDVKPFQPFEISINNKSFSTTVPGISNTNPFLFDSFVTGQSSFDYLTTHDKGYHFSTNSGGVFGDELVMGMKFADWLTFRVNVIDEDRSSQDLFNAGTAISRYGQPEDDVFGYQFGISSVLNITKNWRLGFDVGKGRVGGELLGLYQDQLETTRLGFGIRNNKFGATFQSDFMNGMTNTELEQSTMDIQVDWHFTKDGTISFGARRNIRENTPTGNTLDELTGTVPYIKFKHNL